MSSPAPSALSALSSYMLEPQLDCLPEVLVTQAVQWQPVAKPGSWLWWARRLGTLVLLVWLAGAATVPRWLHGALVALAKMSLRLARAAAAEACA